MNYRIFCNILLVGITDSAISLLKQLCLSTLEQDGYKPAFDAAGKKPFVVK